MDLIETNSNYIVTHGNKSLYFDRLTGKVSVKEAATVLTEWNPICLGRVDGVIGKLRYDPDSCWRLFLIRSSEHVGYLPDGMEIRRITQVATLSLNTQPAAELNLSPCDRSHPEIEKRCSSYVPKPLIDQMRLGLRNATGTVDLKMPHERQRDKYERRIHEELSRLLQMEEEAFFYFAPGGGDVTSWTQRRYASSYWTGLSSTSDSNDSDTSESNWIRPARPAWRQPVWRRADTRFFWNTHMLSEAIADADRLLSAQGFPAYGTPASADVQAGLFEREVSDLEGLLMPIIQGYVEVEKLSLVSPSTLMANRVGPASSTSLATGTQSDAHSVTVYYSATHGTGVEGPGSIVFHGLDPLTPVPEQLPSPDQSLSEYPESHDLVESSRLDSVSELTMYRDTMTGAVDCGGTSIATNLLSPAQSSPSKVTVKQAKKEYREPGDATVILFSRRSRFRAGTRYRRRGIDEEGHVANYVETEQILQAQTGKSSQTVAFLQARGSVPLFWSQTGLKYRPPINLERNDAENQAAFDRHWNDMLAAFKRVVIVTLLDSGRKRSENALAEAYLRHLLLYNDPRLTCVMFDFHDYCRNLRFENASVLLAGIMHLLEEMKFCWVSEEGLLCKQRWIFRLNCLDCLDRTNVVQCLFAEIVMATQLKKFGILGPDDHLPASFMRAMQRMWANHGDAISQQYAGTIAMKGDYTRTGERTMNGMMRDGVSSMNRYYLRFRELARQAAIDLLLGNDDSPELMLFRSGAGLKAASLQAREENIKALIHRCREVLLKPEETGLSECLLLAYSELKFDPQFVNTLLIVTDQYLHFIRTDVSPRSRRPIYIRIPVRAVEKLELGLEPSVFRSKYHVLRIFYTRPSSEETQPVTHTDPSPNRSVETVDKLITAPLEPRTKKLARSNPEFFQARNPPIRISCRVSSDVEQVDAEQAITRSNPIDIHVDHGTTPQHSSATNKPPANPGLPGEQSHHSSIRFSRPVSNAQHFLAFMQPNVRLFNTVLVPVPPGDETVQALQVVAAMILVAIRSTDRDLELLQYPSKVKLERLRQAPVPQAYLPSVDTQRLLADLRMDNGWQRDDTSPRNKQPNSTDEKCVEPDDGGLSSDGADPAQARARPSSTQSKTSSRVDRLRQRLNEIKLPDIRIRLGRRQAPSSDSSNIIASNSAAPIAPDHTSPLPVSTAPASANMTEQSTPAQTNRLSEPHRLLLGLARFAQKTPDTTTTTNVCDASEESKRSAVVAAGWNKQQPVNPDGPDSEELLSSDDSPETLKHLGNDLNPNSLDFSNPTKPLENFGLSDWSQSENEMHLDEDSDNEPDYDRGYADDEEEEEGGTELIPVETEQRPMVVPQISRLVTAHKRSYSDANASVERLIERKSQHFGEQDQIESIKQGDTENSRADQKQGSAAKETMCKVAGSPRSSKSSSSRGAKHRTSLPKIVVDKRHRLMYERISSITGKAWQSGALSLRDWQSELSLNTTSSAGHGSHPQCDRLPRSISIRPEIEPNLSHTTHTTTTATDANATQQLPRDRPVQGETPESEYTLVRSDNMPEIVLENPRQVERLRAKQLAMLNRLDELRNETCPKRPVLSSFIVF